MTKRAAIVARMKPGAREKVAAIFAESDESELPRMAGVRHRSLFLLEDLYVHYVETDDDVDDAIEGVRNHQLFREVSRKLEPYIEAYNPTTWRSPRDAMAEEFYSRDWTR